MRKTGIFLSAGLILLFLASIIKAETKTNANDYSNDPQLVIRKSEEDTYWGDKVIPEYKGNINGAYYTIPSTEYGSFTQEFDIYFEKINNYAWVSIGLASREYTGKMEIGFHNETRTQKMLGSLSFENQGESSQPVVPVMATAEVFFQTGRTYHIKIKYQEGKYIQLVVYGKDEEGLFPLWDSGELKTTGKASFNRVYFGVRHFLGSDIHYDKENKYIYLKGVADSPNRPSQFVFIAHVDNMAIKYEK